MKGDAQRLEALLSGDRSLIIRCSDVRLLLDEVRRCRLALDIQARNRKMEAEACR